MTDSKDKNTIQESSDESKLSLNFIQTIIDEDVKNNKHEGRVHTRFPPEPNGYLHIGHAKAICLNFGLAKHYDGLCNLRFDDTNPIKEEVEYIDSIKEDIKWLGFDWGDRLYYASDYFGTLYEYAVKLIIKGKAFVCEMSSEEITESRGTPTVPGKESLFRNRSVDENLDLFKRMRDGEFKDGEKVLRAKIDMSSPNTLMRDPVIYRIIHTEHHRTGNKWCIYPTYDFTHGQSDSIENITHSLCSIEFEIHRPLYNWFIKELEIFPSRQIEFARLNLNFTITSTRKLLKLVEKNFVNGWDDPRMPTLSGLRRRGYTPEAIKNFVDRVGIAKRENVIDVALLEHIIRKELNNRAPRVMCVLNPLKIVLTNYPDNKTEELDAINNPEDPEMGSRKIPFSKEIYIEMNDFMDDPPKKFFRLTPGREVRLRYAYFIKCEKVIRDEKTGEIIELHCTYDPKSRGGKSPDGRKVKGTLHWVSVRHSIESEIRLYDRLFKYPNPEETEKGSDFTSNLNPDSLKIIAGYIEPSLKGAIHGRCFQFERLGYFCVDPDTSEDKLVFNRTVSLRDSWSKMSN
jgi:glutaminyl-tRNA synthetase